MSSVSRSEIRMTAAEYLKWERQQNERHEFLAGEVFRQAGGTRRHSLIATNVTRVLGNSLSDRDCQVHGSDMKVHVEATGLFAYPDFSVVCPPIEGEADDVISNPIVIGEVLSPSTADYDRGGKFSHYRRISALREYLVIYQDECRVEHHQLADGGLWQLQDLDDINTSLQLSSLKIELKLSQVYDKVEFD